MFVLLCLIAAAAAAPHYQHGPPPYHPDHNPGFHRHSAFFDSDVFDTRRFWADLATEMRQLDDMLADFYKKFPAISSTQQIVGNEYRITIPLSGFAEKDIIVKAREGLLMVQAVQRLPEGGERSYLDIKTLPSTINVAGNWIFENQVLTITFPLKEGTLTTEAPVTEVVTENRSREVIEKHSSDEKDVDVGVNTNNKDNEIFTNEIPNDNRYDIRDDNKVEATTYAVDLKGEVEFVPVRY